MCSTTALEVGGSAYDQSKMREIAACVPVDQYVEICLLNLDCPLQSKPSP